MKAMKQTKKENHNMEEKKIKKTSLIKAFWRWYHGNMLFFTHRHMQTFPFIVAMLKPLQDLYPDEDQLHSTLVNYEKFFNAEPQLGTLILGICLGLEEARANGKVNVNEDMINAVRVGLMGPFSGIGDSLIPGVYIPILLAIAIGLSEGGNPMGAIFYIITYITTMTLFMWFIFMQGYKLGGRSVDVIIGAKANAIKDSLVVLGMIIIGAVAGAWVNVQAQFPLPDILKIAEFTGLNVQDIFDSFLPGSFSILTIAFAWWLMARKKLQPIMVIGIFLVIALVGVILGVFDPSLNF